MFENNSVSWKKRVRELLVDYLVVSIYLLVLLGAALGLYYAIFQGIPIFTQTQSQWIASLTSVIPIVLIFAVLDHNGGSIGKRKAGLTLHRTRKNFGASLLRNVIKFLPWQLGHIGTIRGVYLGYDGISMMYTAFSLILALVLLIMGFARKDKRHLGDLLAGTQVQVRKEGKA
ncbi:RDD family protein [Saccharibacillus alkalitolerans]|uniref:RDD family protein n=1 Tax=Saccharibacillus alkalitolerans TaxID=2705290 RepID=A0ABX0F9B4_9BACL|nr:RDD family protein [Saccharibacillus alkalitolerans]NGZ77492.1 RDD family protein [Saccharibacillus alkalitolerans]